MRVLLVNDLAPDAGWGTETHVRRLARGLESSGDDVHLFAGELEHRGVGKVRDFWDPRCQRPMGRVSAPQVWCRRYRSLYHRRGARRARESLEPQADPGIQPGSRLPRGI